MKQITCLCVGLVGARVIKDVLRALYLFGEIVMLKYILLVILFPCSAYAEAQPALKDGVEIYPVRADGQRDWQANHYRVENGDAVPIRPDGQRDWSANVYRAEGDSIVPVRLNVQRDWQAPAMQVRGK